MQFLIGDHAETRNPCDVSERRGYPCMTVMNPGCAGTYALGVSRRVDRRSGRFRATSLSVMG